MSCARNHDPAALSRRQYPRSQSASPRSNAITRSSGTIVRVSRSPVLPRRHRRKQAEQPAQALAARRLPVAVDVKADRVEIDRALEVALDARERALRLRQVGDEAVDRLVQVGVARLDRGVVPDPAQERRPRAHHPPDLIERAHEPVAVRRLEHPLAREEEVHRAEREDLRVVARVRRDLRAHLSERRALFLRGERRVDLVLRDRVDARRERCDRERRRV